MLLEGAAVNATAERVGFGLDRIVEWQAKPIVRQIFGESRDCRFHTSATDDGTRIVCQATATQQSVGPEVELRFWPKPRPISVEQNHAKTGQELHRQSTLMNADFSGCISFASIGVH